MGLKLSKLTSNGQGQVLPTYFYWECDIQPTPLSRVYRVLIFYGADFIPRAFVLGPNLQGISEQYPIPHLYDQKRGHLCLYHPSSNEWNPTMSIVNDFVPWIYMWLFFFEQWLITQQWEGGGIHPVANSSNSLRESTSTLIKKKKKKKPIMTYKDQACKLYDRRLKSYQKGLEDE